MPVSCQYSGVVVFMMRLKVSQRDDIVSQATAAVHNRRVEASDKGCLTKITVFHYFKTAKRAPCVTKKNKASENDNMLFGCLANCKSICMDKRDPIDRRLPSFVLLKMQI